MMPRRGRSIAGQASLLTSGLSFGTANARQCAPRGGGPSALAPMPDAATHQTQAAHNEDFFSRIALAADADWAVTVLFYAALQYVDAYLARKHNSHPGNHGERGRMILSDPTARAIRTSYRRLQEYSRDARYNCYAFTAGQVAKLKASDFDRVKDAITR